MSVRKRGDRWVAVAYDPRTRKRVWVGTFNRQGEAREEHDRVVAELRRAARRRTETVGEFAARWMSDYPRAKESTTLHYGQQIKAVVDEFGPRLLTDIGRPEARRFALSSPSWRAARAMFSDACRDGLCDSNPFTGMRLPESRGRKDFVVPTEAEVVRLVELAEEIHKDFGRRVYGPMLRFAAYSGLRLGELSGLGWQHVNFAAQTVLVERQWSPKLRKMTTPKNGLRRTIYLTPPAREALELLPRNDENVVFPTPRGTRFGGSVSHYYWHPVRCALGRPDMDFHGLRHFFGTHLALLGLGPVEIAQAMGHTDGGRLAMERYIHMTEQDARAKIAAAFGSGDRRFSVVGAAKEQQRDSDAAS